MTSKEEWIVEKMLEKFPFVAGGIKIPSPRRIITGGFYKAHFGDVFKYVVNELNFCFLHLIVGTDDGEKLGVIYILSDKNKIVMLLRLNIPKDDAVINTVTDVFPNALWHERELVDLFGVTVVGLPEGPRYPLPDDWPEGSYPLRKEWNPAYFDKQTMTYQPPAALEAASEEGEETGNEQ